MVITTSREYCMGILFLLENMYKQTILVIHVIWRKIFSKIDLFFLVVAMVCDYYV